MALTDQAGYEENFDNNVYSMPPTGSASICLPPNPDPPPFDALYEPLVIETRRNVITSPAQSNRFIFKNIVYIMNFRII